MASVLKLTKEQFEYFLEVTQLQTEWEGECVHVLSEHPVMWCWLEGFFYLVQ